MTPSPRSPKPRAPKLAALLLLLALSGCQTAPPPPANDAPAQPAAVTPEPAAELPCKASAQALELHAAIGFPYQQRVAMLRVVGSIPLDAHNAIEQLKANYPQEHQAYLTRFLTAGSTIKLQRLSHLAACKVESELTPAELEAALTKARVDVPAALAEPRLAAAVKLAYDDMIATLRSAADEFQEIELFANATRGAYSKMTRQQYLKFVGVGDPVPPAIQKELDVELEKIRKLLARKRYRDFVRLYGLANNPDDARRTAKDLTIGGPKLLAALPRLQKQPPQNFHQTRHPETGEPILSAAYETGYETAINGPGCLVLSKERDKWSVPVICLR